MHIIIQDFFYSRRNLKAEEILQTSILADLFSFESFSNIHNNFVYYNSSIKNSSSDFPMHLFNFISFYSSVEFKYSWLTFCNEFSRTKCLSFTTRKVFFLYVRIEICAPFYDYFSFGAISVWKNLGIHDCRCCVKSWDKFHAQTAQSVEIRNYFWFGVFKLQSLLILRWCYMGGSGVMDRVSGNPRMESIRFQGICRHEAHSCQRSFHRNGRAGVAQMFVHGPDHGNVCNPLFNFLDATSKHFIFRWGP